MKLSLAAYSYRQYLTAKRAPNSICSTSSIWPRTWRLDGVEPTSYYFPPDVTADYSNRLKLHAFSLGWTSRELPSATTFAFRQVPSGTNKSGSCERWIDNAAELDAPVIRIFAGNVARDRPRNRPLPGPSRASKPCCLTPPKRGSCWLSRITAESPATPAQILKLVKAIDSPNFGVNLDTGNFRGSDPYAEIAQLAPYAMNVQVKTEIQRGNGHPKEEADLARIVGILREAHYSDTSSSSTRRPQTR